MAAWRIFGHETTAEQLPAELRSILAQMQRERVAFEALANAARESAQNLTQLNQPIVDAQKTVSELQTRVKALERLVPVLATLAGQTTADSRAPARPPTQPPPPPRAPGGRPGGTGGERGPPGARLA